MPVYGDRYIKTTMRRYGDEGYTVFCALNVPEDGVEYDFFTIISIDPCLWEQNVDNQDVDNQNVDKM